MSLYQIDLGYACFLIEVEEGKVSHAPGMAKWTIGKDWEEIRDYYKEKKNATITKCKL